MPQFFQTAFRYLHRQIIVTGILLMPLLTGCTDGSLSSFSLPGFGNNDSSQGNYETVQSSRAEMSTAIPSGSLPPVTCAAATGSAHFDQGWYDIQPVTFTLLDGRPANVTLQRKSGGGTMAFQAMLDSASQRMVFCPVIDGPPDQRITCASLYALEDDFQTGFRRTFDIPDALRGSAITCAFGKDHLIKL